MNTFLMTRYVSSLFSKQISTHKKKMKKHKWTNWKEGVLRKAGFSLIKNTFFAILLLQGIMQKLKMGINFSHSRLLATLVFIRWWEKRDYFFQNSCILLTMGVKLTGFSKNLESKTCVWPSDSEVFRELHS